MVAVAIVDARKGKAPTRDEHLADTLTKAQALAPTSHTLTIRRGSFQAFVRLSDREQRPVEEVLAEWIADCASLIRQSEEEVYGDARPSTPAMQRAAAASDAREEYDWHHRADLIEDGTHPALVDINLSLEGE